MSGERFGRLQVDGYVGDGKWSVVCDCGRTKVVKGNHLRAGATLSCGCLKREPPEVRAAVGTGHQVWPKPTVEQTTWWAMIARCHNPKRVGFRHYGGRGIVVCNRWRESFDTFLADVGPRPSPEHSLDRCDNDGNYEPGNVRWATVVEQGRNRRTNVLIEHEGRRLCAKEWSEAVGLPADVIVWRIRSGWTVERALTQPLARRRDNRRAA